MSPPQQRNSTLAVLRVLLGDLMVVAAVFLAVEVLLRITAPQPVHRLLRYVYQPLESGFGMKPGSRVTCNLGFGDQEVIYNSWGGRDCEHGPKQPGEWRILLIGDSFLENIALALDDTYPKVLEANLRRTYPDRRFSTVCLARAGWGLWDYLRSLKKMLPVVKPDVVVVSMLAIGDTIETTTPPKDRRYKILAGLPVLADTSPLQRLKWGVWFANEMLEDYSHAYVAFRRLINYPCAWLGIGRMSKLSPMCTNPAEPERVRNPVTYLLRRPAGVIRPENL